ncbi:hypothetical protein HXX25_11800 [Hyphobacterium sp. CCMP332]|uniref:hypothetical protein n=1 Tax=Hyphobacterium sp. CCMP332 TaxID=2749086 RepID=UPI00164F8465|nr:hypothetical protein [Hyphobacterium sp. CCMP332]QNL19950.1 hypothetical protein HXX25_11800 [Hyphobacterium sp. CCMP332]
MNPVIKRISLFAILFGLLVNSAEGLQLNNAEQPEVNFRDASLEDWQADLVQLDTAIRDQHPALRFSETRDMWNDSVEQIRVALPTQSATERLAALSHLVASLEDGHSNVVPFFVQSLGFEKQLPIRVFDFDDGVFVIQAEPGNESLLAQQIVSINDMPIEDVRTHLISMIGRENDQWGRNWMPTLLSNPVYLEAIGAMEIDGAIVLTVQDNDGMRRQVRLEPGIPTGELVDARSSTAINRARPPADPERNIDFAVIDGGQTIYVAFNAVEDNDNETIADVSARIQETATRLGTTRVIFDVRRNRGGNNFLNEAIIRDTIRAGLDHSEGTIVLVGRQTFSAAMNFVTEAERHLDAVLIGEPTGGAPNHFGDANFVNLTMTGLPVIHSTLYWQGSLPTDTRRTVTPNVVVPVMFDDWLAGHDVVLEAALADNRP